MFRHLHVLVLMVGMLTADAPGNAVDSTATVTGKIVSADTDRFVVRSEAGKEMQLHVVPRTEFHIDGTPAKPGAFQNGDRVRIVYQSNEGRLTMTAVRNAPTFEEVRRKAREAFDAAKDYSFKQKDEYRKRLNSVIHNIDQQLEELQDHARAKTGEAKAAFDKQIDNLKQKRDQLNARLKKTSEASADAWQELKDGVGNAWEDLQQAFDQARAKLKEQ